MISIRSKNKTILFGFIIIFAAIALRLIHLDADTPSGLSWSAGLYVDEGYKTLSPRNLYFLGSTHWHPADTYPGWMDKSPLTQWPVYAAFKAFGADITSARVVPIIYFALFMLVCAFVLHRKYPPRLYYLGLILLGIDATLFTFSRVALFEVPLSFFLYSLLLPLSLLHEETQKSLLPIVWITIGGIAITFSIKLSAFVYIACIIAPVIILYALKKYQLSQKNVLVLFASFALIFGTVLALTYNTWIERIGATPVSYIYDILTNPLLVTSPLLLIAGTACAAHAIVYQPDLYLKNAYRLCLLSLVVAAPFILSLFVYNPLRYYVPLTPAYILLIIEWYKTTLGQLHIKPPRIANIAAGLVLSAIIILFAFSALGIHEFIQMRYLIIISMISVSVTWYFRHYLLSKFDIKHVITALIFVYIFHNAIFISSFVFNPTYDARDMRKTVMENVNEDSVIAGGWAPFIALGTPLKSLYAGLVFNPPEALKIIKPDYYVLSETPNVLEAFKALQEDPDIYVGTGIDLGKYNDTKVFLHPLSYSQSND